MTLKTWLTEHGFDCDVENGEVFEYDWVQEKIYCGALPENDFNAWNELMVELGLNVKISNEAMAFLHELGHFITYDDFLDDEFDDTDLIKGMLGIAPITKASYEIYYHLPVEIAATEWAVNYINSNPEEAVILDSCFEEV